MKKLSVKNSCITFLVAFILGQLATIFLAAIALIVGKFSNVDSTAVSSFFNTPWGYLLANLVLDATFVLCFFIFNSKDNKIINNTKVWKILLYILIGVLAIFTLGPVIVAFNTLLIKLGIKLQGLPYELTTKNYFISILSMAILPAIAEELLFRGLIFKGLKKHGKSFAVISTTIMFMLFHMAIDQAAYPMLIGLLLGVIMWKEDNIIYCIAVHMTNNIMSLTISYFNIPLSFNHWTFILMAILIVLAYLTAILFYTIKNGKGEALSKEEKIYFSATLAIMTIIWIIVVLIRNL